MIVIRGSNFGILGDEISPKNVNSNKEMKEVFEDLTIEVENIDGSIFIILIIQ